MMTDLNPDEWDLDNMLSSLWDADDDLAENIVAWARFCWWLAR